MSAAVRFTKHLDVRFFPPSDPALGSRKQGKAYAQLLAPLVWEIDYTGAPLPTDDPALLSQDHYVVMPEGYIFDGISSPRALWWLVPPWGSNASRASGLHDWLLEALAEGNPHPRFLDRKSIDLVFYEALRAIGVRTSMATVLWCGVRLFTHWRRFNPKR